MRQLFLGNLQALQTVFPFLPKTREISGDLLLALLDFTDIMVAENALHAVHKLLKPLRKRALQLGAQLHFSLSLKKSFRIFEIRPIVFRRKISAVQQAFRNFRSAPFPG